MTSLKSLTAILVLLFLTACADSGPLVQTKCPTYPPTLTADDAKLADEFEAASPDMVWPDAVTQLLAIRAQCEALHEQRPRDSPPDR